MLSNLGNSLIILVSILSFLIIYTATLQIYIKRRLRPQQPGRLSKVLENVAEMQLSSQKPSPN